MTAGARWRGVVVLLAGLTLAGCGTAPTPSTSTAASAPSAAPTASPTPTAEPTPTPRPSPAAVQLKLMDFNIEYGGQQVDFAKIVEAVKLADPDVVAIEEAEGHTQELADKAGYPYANVRNQVISKFPIIDPPGADGRYVYIEVAPGAVVALSNVHLPSDPYGPYLVRDGGTVEAVLKLENDTRMPAIQQRLDVSCRRCSPRGSRRSSRATSTRRRTSTGPRPRSGSCRRSSTRSPGRSAPPSPPPASPMRIARCTRTRSSIRA